MLRPIPPRILTHAVTFHVASYVDAWGNATTADTVVTRCCMQPSNETRKTNDNTEVVLRSVLFIDYRLSLPQGIDIDALKDTSEANGKTLTLTFDGKEYTVLTVDSIYDDQGRPHHTELGLT